MAIFGNLGIILEIIMLLSRMTPRLKRISQLYKVIAIFFPFYQFLGGLVPIYHLASGIKNTFHAISCEIFIV